MSDRRPRGRGLAGRFLAAIVAVVLVGSATAWAVAGTIGPVIFHQHLAHHGYTDPEVDVHAEDAFRTASALTLALALMVALATSVLVSVFLSRRITRSLAPVTVAAGQVAAGDHTVRVPPVGMGAEFDDLTAAFNTMATDLERTESTRTRMLADLAHEMRTPVATLDGYLEAILDGVQHPDESTLAMLRGQVARLARLAEDITLVTTAEEGRLTMQREHILLSQIVHVAATQAEGRYADRGVTLTVRDSTATGAPIDGDVDRIGQVLTNLLENALRHTPPGGNVAVTLDIAGRSAHLSVADDGVGIAREHLPHLFERFYRVDTARDRVLGGSGVGLSIVKAITEAHGGVVSATSAGVGRGARFTLTLPLATREGEPAGRSAGPARQHGAHPASTSG